MSKPKFKVGDVVRVRATSEVAAVHKLVPDFVPAPGTVGGFEEIESDLQGGWIRWTGEHGCHADRTWVPFEYVEPAIEAITIYRSGRSVYAKDLMTHRIAEAKCSPEDAFDFYKGSALALDRLFDREEPKPEEPKYYNGKVVCVERGPGEFGSLEVIGYYWWTVGKIYDVVNGVILDDEGDPRCQIKTLEELNEREDKYAKFIALADTKLEEPKYYNGKVVCIKTGFGPYVDVDVTWWTVGKIYDVIDGVIRDNEGDPRPPVGSLEELNRITADYAEFVALVE